MKHSPEAVIADYVSLGDKRMIRGPPEVQITTLLTFNPNWAALMAAT